MPELIRIVLADDHALARRGVVNALRGHGFGICAEAENAAGAVAAVLEHDPDVCLLDIRMPGDGVAAAVEISERAPRTAIVMLTMSDEDEDLLGAVAAGASGYLLKDIEPARLPEALKAVLRGDATIPVPLVLRALREIRRREAGVDGRAVLGLSDREREVLEHVRSGATTAEVASAVGISHSEVRGHVSDMLRKLDLPDRKAAMRLLSPPPMRD